MWNSTKCRIFELSSNRRRRIRNFSCKSHAQNGEIDLCPILETLAHFLGRILVSPMDRLVLQIGEHSALTSTCCSPLSFSTTEVSIWIRERMTQRKYVRCHSYICELFCRATLNHSTVGAKKCGCWLQLLLRRAQMSRKDGLQSSCVAQLHTRLYLPPLRGDSAVMRPCRRSH